jgi:hypothetical protein
MRRRLLRAQLQTPFAFSVMPHGIQVGIRGQF